MCKDCINYNSDFNICCDKDNGIWVKVKDTDHCDKCEVEKVSSEVNDSSDYRLHYHAVGE